MKSRTFTLGYKNHISYGYGILITDDKYLQKVLDYYSEFMVSVLHVNVTLYTRKINLKIGFLFKLFGL